MRRRKVFGALCTLLRPCAGFVPVFGLLIFVGALFWAKHIDPFSRKWFEVKTADGGSVRCIAVLPKPIRPSPVIIYAHGSGGSLMKDGFDLRQMAEMGLATVSLEYNQSNGVAFNGQFNALLRYIVRQTWADTNAIAWVGFSLGANRMLDFAVQHPEQSPHLLVLLGGKGMDQSTTNDQPSILPPLLLIHGEQDEIFPIAGTKRLASVLQTNGMSVELKIISSAPHRMEPERDVVFRCIGEYCLTQLSSKAEMSLVTSAATRQNALLNYNSIAQWQAKAPSLLWFWLPAMTWVGGWGWWKFGRRGSAALPLKRFSRSEAALCWMAVLLPTWALAETALHLVPPRFSVSERILGIARGFLVGPKEHADFEFLADQPIWRAEKLKTMLTHVELVGYNRELINWKLDDTVYREQVLSPVITGATGEQLNWRRPLWEEFYPRIRRESSPEDVAKIVVRHLRERVTIADRQNQSREVPDIWLKQITDEAGFEIIYVAALRSVGIPARLDTNRHAEFHDSNKWQTAPSPSVVNWNNEFKITKQ